MDMGREAKRIELKAIWRSYRGRSKDLSSLRMEYGITRWYDLSIHMKIRNKKSMEKNF